MISVTDWFNHAPLSFHVQRSRFSKGVSYFIRIQPTSKMEQVITLKTVSSEAFIQPIKIGNGGRPHSRRFIKGVLSQERAEIGVWESERGAESIGPYVRCVVASE